MMEIVKCSYGGWDNCLEISNEQVKLLITLDVGPRVIFYGFVGGQNMFKNFDEQMGQIGGDKWKIYGGHRLWHAPEVAPRTYFPDNEAVSYERDGNKIILDCPPEADNKLKKVIEIELDENSSKVKLSHKIFNVDSWDKEFSVWCLTVMAPGGRVIIPQEPYLGHGDGSYGPVRPLVLWPYANMADPRFTWGEKYIQMREDSNFDSKQKIGLLNKQGWTAYVLKGDLFLKKYDYDADAEYPDYNCNSEFFTMPGMLEMETLSPLKRVAPGECLENNETWTLFKVDVSEDEADINAKVLPLL